MHSKEERRETESLANDTWALGPLASKQVRAQFVEGSAEGADVHKPLNSTSCSDQAPSTHSKHTWDLKCDTVLHRESLVNLHPMRNEKLTVFTVFP